MHLLAGAMVLRRHSCAMQMALWIFIAAEDDTPNTSGCDAVELLTLHTAAPVVAAAADSLLRVVMQEAALVAVTAAAAFDPEVAVGGVRDVAVGDECEDLLALLRGLGGLDALVLGEDHVKVAPAEVAVTRGR